MRSPRAMLLKNISQISLQCWGGAERQPHGDRREGAVLSLQRSVDNTPLCPSMRWVQPRFPEAPSGCRTDALRSGARRGGASVRRVPLRRRGGNMWRTLARLPPVGAWITPSLMRTFFLSESKKCQTFNLRSHTQFCYREKVVLLACANSPPERYRRIHVL